MVDANYIDGSRQLSGGIETTYGTVAGTLTGWMGLIQDFKGAVKKTVEPVHGMGLNRQANSVEVLAEDVSGSIEFHPQNAALLQFLGDMETTGSSPYTHTVSPDNDPASFSLVDTKVDPSGGSNHVTRQYVGCMIQNMVFQYSAKALVKSTANFVAKDATKTTTKQSLTPVTTAPYNVANTALKVDTVEDENMFDATVTIETGLNADAHVFNSLNIAKPCPGNYAANVTFSRNFVNSDIYDMIVADTEIDLQFLTTRAGSDTFTINLTDCKLSDHDLSSGIEGKSQDLVTVVAEGWETITVDSTATYTVL